MLVLKLHRIVYGTTAQFPVPFTTGGVLKEECFEIERDEG